MIDARDQILSSAPAARRRSGRAIAPAAAMKSSASKKSLRVERVFSDAKVNPFDQIEWDKRTAEITDDAGKVRASGNTNRSNLSERKASALVKVLRPMISVS